MEQIHSGTYDQRQHPPSPEHGLEPALHGDGPEVTPNECLAEKLQPQVAFGQQWKEITPRPDLPYTLQPSSPRLTRRRVRRPLWVITLVIVVVLVVIAVIVAVLVTRRRRNDGKSQSTAPDAPSATSPANPTLTNPTSVDSNSTNSNGIARLSSAGAFSGTGLATMFPGNNVDLVYVFYQQSTGDLRYARFSGNAVWQASESLGLNEVMNGTSLGAIEYTLRNNVTMRHVFYVSTSGVIHDVIQRDDNNVWVHGSLWNYNIQASKSQRIALSTSFVSGFYVDEWIILYAGGEDGLVHEYACNLTDSTWSTGFTFPKTNGYGGSIPYASGTSITLYLQNANNELELWWRDERLNGTTADNPTVRGTWTKGAVAATPIRSNSSITMCLSDKTIYYQDLEDKIQSIGWTGDTDKQRWETPYPVGGATAIAGTAITCGFFYPLQGGPANSIHVYFQTNGSNIVEYSRGTGDRNWSVDDIPSL